MPKVAPLIVQSPLTGRYYIVTSYAHKTAPNGTPYIDARTKYDCTKRIEEIIAAALEAKEDANSHD